jgi:hypothetical protein
MTTIKDKLKIVFNKNDELSLKIDNEVYNRNKNDETIKTANKIYLFLKQGKEFIYDFAPLDILTVNGVNLAFYKQWQVQIYENTNPTELNYMFNLISTNLSYNIIYNEEVENILDYYNLGNELRQMGFFSLEGNVIFFNVSVYIKQIFNTGSNPHDYTPIINPQVKLQINIRPFLSVKR